MIRILSLICVFGMFTSTVFSQKKKDIESIKNMCGCFDVGFNFTETFHYSKDSTYKPSPVKHANAQELAYLIEETKDKLVIQHILVMEHGGKTHIVKHWRQDWVYQNQDLYTYNGENEWLYSKLPTTKAKKTWTQKVYQVDDSPRYEGAGTWVYIDGKTYWENTTTAPLPRREYTVRSDYNITERGNRVEITKDGWVHEQDNKKILRENGKDVLIAEEKGYNTYKKLDLSKCQAGIDWWKENGEMWTTVRAEFDHIYAQNKDIKMHRKLKNKFLYQQLFKMPKDTPREEIRELIVQYLK